MTKTELNTQEKIPKISVIIPCFNAGAYIDEAVNSVLSQTFQDFEIIIIDDGSEDQTHEIVMSYVEKDHRFKYIRQENKGLSASRNKGLQNAKGEFIQFLDADDLLSSDKFENQIAAFRKNNHIDIIYSEYLCFGDHNINKRWIYSRVLIKDPPLKDLILNWERDLSIPIHCFLFRMSCFVLWGQFDETLPNHEDWDIQIRFANSGARYKIVPGRTALYRIREHSISRNLLEMTMGRDLVINKHIDKSSSNFQLKLALGERKVETILICLRILLTYKKGLNAKYLSVWKMIRSFPPFNNFGFLCISILFYLTRTIIKLPFKIVIQITNTFFIKNQRHFHNKISTSMEKDLF